jgi:hypothetical protein
MSTPRFRCAAAALALAAGLCLACGPDRAASWRAFTYGPDFNYLTQKQIETTMGQLALGVEQLNAVMEAGPEIDSEERELILSLLSQMEQDTKPLGLGGWPSNHPRISTNVERLREDLRRAQRAVEAEPPNYFWVGSISAACSHCHAPRT